MTSGRVGVVEVGVGVTEPSLEPPRRIVDDPEQAMRVRLSTGVTRQASTNRV